MTQQTVPNRGNRRGYVYTDFKVYISYIFTTRRGRSEGGTPGPTGRAVVARRNFEEINLREFSTDYDIFMYREPRNGKRLLHFRMETADTFFDNNNNITITPAVIVPIIALLPQRRQQQQ